MIKQTLMFLLILMVLPLALAEEIEEEKEPEKVEEEKELLPFKTNHGATVRLLQLERSIQMNILRGEKILEEFHEDIDENQTEDLEAILISLEDLKEKVSNYEVGSEEDVEKFVFFKQEAITLTKEFREIITNQIQEDARENARERITKETRNNEEIRNKTETIRERAREHNEEVVRNINASNIITEELLNKIRSNEIDPKEIRTQVLNNIRNQRSEQANETLRRISEDARQRAENARQEAIRLREEFEENHAQRIRESIIEVKNRTREEIKQRIDARTPRGEEEWNIF